MGRLDPRRLETSTVRHKTSPELVVLPWLSDSSVFSDAVVAFIFEVVEGVVAAIVEGGSELDVVGLEGCEVAAGFNWRIVVFLGPVVFLGSEVILGSEVFLGSEVILGSVVVLRLVVVLRFIVVLGFVVVLWLVVILGREGPGLLIWIFKVDLPGLGGCSLGLIFVLGATLALAEAVLGGRVGEE